MHTMRYHHRLWLFPLAAIGLGCSSTGGQGRSAEENKIRTIASIGDRPVSSSSGTPSSSAVANLDTPERKRDGRDLVSGRVVDDRGDPVPSARVRVADGGLSGGKVVQAKTDKAGGFTLHGLRPGSTYTLIAEYEGKDGPVEGRSEVKSPQEEVEIALSGDDQTLDRRRASRSPLSRNISQRRPVDEADENDRPLKLNRDDTPDRSDIEDVDDLAGKTSMRTRAGTAVPVSSWRRTDGKPSMSGSALASSAVDDRATQLASTKVASDNEDDPLPEPKSRRGAEPPSVVEDEGENPLPPAIEPNGSQKPRPTSDPHRDESVQRPRPPSRVAKSKTNSPGPQPGAFALGREGLSTEGTPTRPRLGNIAPPPAPEADTTPFTDPFAQTSRKASTTFGDLANTWKSKPNDDLMDRPDQQVARGTTKTKVGAAKVSIEACRYDSKQRQILNFRLPDLDGRPVTLKDFDSDLILLDFWGTWCRPCLSSVPHLVELQERLGTKRLTIIGIACEEGPATANATHVAEVAERLGINYSVLLSSKDQPSPLLEALHIQAFPTMIVVDREGRIVWRDQGATDFTLARLDRAVDTSSRAGTSAPVRR